MSDDIRERLHREVLICDGAMGTMLHTAGIAVERPLTEVNLSNPDLVRSIHQDYIAAGAQIIQTNTFGAVRPRLELHALEGRVAEINRAGAEIARGAASSASPTPLVAGSVGPVATGAMRTRVTSAERQAAWSNRSAPCSRVASTYSSSRHSGIWSR